jgi:glycosyltransferase involved in cell wall biosynthesis
MRVWLLNVGEPLPTDPGNERLLRAGIVAEMLVARGHDVTWWTSAFHHVLKLQRVDSERVVYIAPNYRIQFLFGGGYARNISIERIRDHRRLAERFRALAPSHPRPEVIVSSLPLPELSLAAVEYGRRLAVPVVLDIRDLWPDIFVELAPNPLRAFAQIAVSGMRRTVRRACAGATAIWGHAPAFVEWGLKQAGRAATELDRAFPFGYVSLPPSGDEVEQARNVWREFGLSHNSTDVTACFIGTIGHQFRLDTILDTARELRGEPGIRFIFCGTGDRLQQLQRRARDVHSVIFVGWRRRAEIWTLLRLASLGLAPYLDRFDYAATIPNKAPEYLSGGLPIALSLRSGPLHDLLVSRGCGFSYGDDPRRLAATLIELRDDRDRLKRMSNAASALFEEDFRADRVYGAMIDAMCAVAQRIVPS